MGTKRTHVVIPEELVRTIDELVGSRGRSRFLTEAAARELRRLKQMRALANAVGSWKDEDYPELRDGSDQWVEKLRKEDEERFPRVARR